MNQPGAEAWWSFATAGRVVFGRSSSRLLTDVVRPLGTRVLICTDKNLVSAGVLDAVMPGSEESAGIEFEVYDSGEPEISVEHAEACADEARRFRPDVVVGLGGGSNIDLAKVVAARLRTPSRIADWLSGEGPTAALPIVAVPTTAGTGSEVTSVAVVTDESDHTKVGIASPALLPRFAIVDPTLTYSCPPRVTAYSGMDALTHAIEAYLAISYTDRRLVPLDRTGFVGKNPLSDVLALEAIRRLAAGLRRSVHDGADAEARDDTALGSLLAGLAFSGAGTGIVHALQYPLGAMTKTAHGYGNALLLPAAVKHNLPDRVAECATVSRLLGSSAGDDVAAGELPGRLTEFATDVGITPGLASIGVTADDLPGMAAAAAKITRLTDNNPRAIDQAGLLSVLQDALNWPAALAS